MDVNKLSPESRHMFETFNRWCQTNWESTLINHDIEIKNLFHKSEIFDKWSNILLSRVIPSKLSPEIYIDCFMSIHFACMGLYKYAYMSLRSELENVLRLIYFSTHPTEYNWWIKGEFNPQRNVWSDWQYFDKLEYVKIFNKKNQVGESLFQLFQSQISTSYRTLSQSVHTSSASFQTRGIEVTPRYDFSEFKPWKDKFNEIQSYIHVILILSFLTEFNAASPSDQSTIIEKGIDYRDFKPKLQETLKEIRNP